MNININGKSMNILYFVLIYEYLFRNFVNIYEYFVNSNKTDISEIAHKKINTTHFYIKISAIS